MKRTSPTAYCDCWEKCKCKALIMGNQAVRFELLTRLVKDTDLVVLPNSRYDCCVRSLWNTWLCKIVAGARVFCCSWCKPSADRIRNKGSLGIHGRGLLLQIQGIRHHRQMVSRTVNDKVICFSPQITFAFLSSYLTTFLVESDMPEHDLEPPRFSRRALECLLGDWKAVRSMIMSGSKDKSENVQSDNSYIAGQTGTTLLDKFTHCFLVKCHLEVLEVLIETLVREMKNNDPERAEYAKNVVRRFVRSVVRIFVIFSIEMAPTSTKRRR